MCCTMEPKALSESAGNSGCMVVRAGLITWWHTVSGGIAGCGHDEAVFVGAAQLAGSDGVGWCKGVCVAGASGLGTGSLVPHDVPTVCIANVLGPAVCKWCSVHSWVHISFCMVHRSNGVKLCNFLQCGTESDDIPVFCKDILITSFLSGKTSPHVTVLHKIKLTPLTKAQECTH
jgi:hypothetical protein